MKAASLPAFVESLKAWGTVWAPVEKAPDVFTLEPIDDVTKARPDALRTILPFKKLLMKPRFTMVESDAGGPRESHDNDRGPIVFFGAHACDVHALKILDMLYLSDFQDSYYKRNREQLTVVGYGCWPDGKCFCDSLGTSHVDEVFDLFLNPIDDRYMVTVRSARGDDIVRANAALFQPLTRQDTRDYLARVERRRQAFTLKLDVSDLPYILELKKDDPVWDELGKKCLCCGSCSMVCPTCACFNVLDEIRSEGGAQRLRCWDACLFRDYAVVAGGHNFRGDRADRVRNRYYHKQEAFVREFGMPSCVGCGRCIENCPTGINVVEVFQQVRGEAC
ncbi:MAG TPA: 4Fe-4S dicluster domain-containing protein [Vicinamibacteria bacterium]|nr:4Fe-4S dicluster domain-containing protein [Vicinamibacteria bacterium]